jgi:gliding motility-associated lipoprotein GldD
MMNKLIVFLLIITGAFTLSSCQDDFSPKPRGYNRIELLPKGYHTFDSTCNFAFEIPQYAAILPYDGPDARPCWLNIHFPYYNATLHLSYSPVQSENGLFKLIEDSRRLVYKHTIKADEIIENYIERPGKSGIVYELTGNTATALQFYMTDSTQHFLRGSLYFNIRTNPDSVAPVLQYLTNDVEHLISSLHWKK